MVSCFIVKICIKMPKGEGGLEDTGVQDCKFKAICLSAPTWPRGTMDYVVL